MILTMFFRSAFYWGRLLFPTRERERLAYLLTRTAKELEFAGTARYRVGTNVLTLEMHDLWQAHMLLRCYEPDVEWLIKRTIQAGATYVDVGAQLGYTAALVAEQASNRIGKMILIEPDPRVQGRLRENVRSTIAAGNISLLDVACSDGSSSQLKLRLFEGWGIHNSTVSPRPRRNRFC